MLKSAKLEGTKVYLLFYFHFGETVGQKKSNVCQFYLQFLDELLYWKVPELQLPVWSTPAHTINIMDIFYFSQRSLSFQCNWDDNQVNLY